MKMIAKVAENTKPMPFAEMDALLQGVSAYKPKMAFDRASFLAKFTDIIEGPAVITVRLASGSVARIQSVSNGCEIRRRSIPYTATDTRRKSDSIRADRDNSELGTAERFHA